MQSEGLLLIALQPGHVPQLGQGASDAGKVVKFPEQGQTLHVVRHCFVVLGLLEGPCPKRKESISHNPLAAGLTSQGQCLLKQGGGLLAACVSRQFDQLRET